MKVSLITVCYNSESTIEDTLKSVQSQTYSDIEYILVDGGSSDKTNEIIKRYSDIISTHVSELDDGLYDAMNKGIKIASGDIVGILNSDDVFSSEHSLSNLMAGFDTDNVDGVYSDLVHVSEDDLDKVTRFYSSKGFNKFLIRFGFMLPHPTLYLRKSVYDKYGLYKKSYVAAADFEFITRVISNGVILKRLPVVSIKMRDGGVSSNGFWGRVSQNFEIVRGCKENSIYTNIFLVMLKIPYKFYMIILGHIIKKKF